MPLPNAEPIGLPAPAWLLQVLLVLTFTLHIIPMTFTVGGSIAATYLEIAGRLRANAHQLRLARKFWSILPSITSFTITLGVAPLLFVQLVYGKFFYPASVLTGWTWFAVVPLLIVGYGMLYVQAMSQPENRFRPWAGILAVVAFLTVAAVYVSTMSLTTVPEEWMGLYTASQAGTHWFFKLPRFLHVLVGALAMAGGLAGLLGHLTADDAGFSRYARRFGLTWLTTALILQVPAGLWYKATIPAAGQAAVGLWLFAALGLLTALGWGAFVIAGQRGRSPLLAWTGMAALGLATALLAIQRHLVRQALLEPHITTADWKLQPQWDVFGIFAVLLVLTLGLIGYLVLRFFRDAGEETAKLGRTAD